MVYALALKPCADNTSDQDRVLSDPVFPIATRTSPLAMAQALMVQSMLANAHGRDGETAFPILGMKTTGDKITDRALLAAGGKGLFTKELETALLEDSAAFAVHSMKDVPTQLPEGLEIAAILKREDPRDLLITRQGAARLEDLPDGARLGTASLRRQAQALHRRPDLQITLLRGNVQTRLAKLEAGEVDATFLAIAGLKRLGHPLGEADPIDPRSVLPAPAQGAIGIEIRSSHAEARALLAPLHDEETALRIMAERAVLEALDGSCRTPIAAYATIHGRALGLTGMAYSPDGKDAWGAQSQTHKLTHEGVRDAGHRIGALIRKQGGAVLEAIISAADTPSE